MLVGQIWEWYYDTLTWSCCFLIVFLSLSHISLSYTLTVSLSLSPPPLYLCIPSWPWTCENPPANSPSAEIPGVSYYFTPKQMKQIVLSKGKFLTLNQTTFCNKWGMYDHVQGHWECVSVANPSSPLCSVSKLMWKASMSWICITVVDWEMFLGTITSPTELAGGSRSYSWVKFKKGSWLLISNNSNCPLTLGRIFKHQFRILRWRRGQASRRF